MNIQHAEKVIMQQKRLTNKPTYRIECWRQLGAVSAVSVLKDIIYM